MKKYYTLVQIFTPQTDRCLGEYLEEQGIEFELGADFESELLPFGYAKSRLPNGKDELLKKYTILIEDHELSAIMLSVGGVKQVGNRPFVTAKNKLRSCLGWFDK
jgi:hypothetical protein